MSDQAGVALAETELLPLVFDPDRLHCELEANLPKALRDLADAIEAGAMDGNLSGFTPLGFGSDCRDSRVHLLVKLHLAAEIRKPMSVIRQTVDIEVKSK